MLSATVRPCVVLLRGVFVLSEIDTNILYDIVDQLENKEFSLRHKDDGEWHHVMITVCLTWFNVLTWTGFHMDSPGSCLVYRTRKLGPVA